MITRESETAALFALLQAPPAGVPWHTLAAMVSAEDSALEILTDAKEALFPDPEAEERLQRAAEQVRAWLEQGLNITTVLESSYPRRLRDIWEMPPFLFYQGDLNPNDLGMSVVGSRHASPQGIERAQATAQFLVEEGLTVIAGLAEGIDTAAHRAALDAGGRTVAFIGTGITRYYPVMNRTLQDAIAQRGLLLSQFYPDAPPTKRTFPMRNVLMSGYGLATIVIEANERSGTRIQARVAGKHGRPVILTDMVTTATEWGRELSKSPNVYVVSSMAEMREAIQSVRNSPNELDQALTALIAS